VALYPDPNNPLNMGVPDLHAIIDRFTEGQLDTQDEQQPVGAAEFDKYRSHAMGETPQSIMGPDGTIRGRAAEFATPQDLSNFARTGSLATGDNGIGAFGHNTAGPVPYVAVPSDVLKAFYRSENAANGKFVEVTSPNGTTAKIQIGDKGPALANRANNAVIELNPAAKALLGSGDSNGYIYRLLP
jgi:hypothetical protein